MLTFGRFVLFSPVKPDRVGASEARPFLVETGIMFTDRLVFKCLFLLHNLRGLFSQVPPEGREAHIRK